MLILDGIVLFGNNEIMAHRVISWLIVLAVAVVVAVILTRINKRIFRGLQKRKGGIHFVFFERLNGLIIVIIVIILAVAFMGGLDSVWKTLLGGTAIISAVIAFAAQDVIKDLLSGLMISMHKPFEIGNRIELENGTAGIVEDVTMRHTIIRGVDTSRIIIPNRKLSDMMLTNLSFGRNERAVRFRFPVGYDTDIDTAKKVIAKVVEESAYSVPWKRSENDEASYSPVYFMEFGDSALIMEVTVFFNGRHPAEFVKDDINTRVRKALLENNIEIPYQYVNVVQKYDESRAEKEFVQTS